MPAWCQASPNSPPPRRLGIARMPPRSTHTARADAKLGVKLMLKPP
jgi:hypothetical protein